jgi:excinuclease ABC subunit C
MALPPIPRARLDALPDKPGCYLMRDGQGRIIYVGKAASLRKRVRSYFRESTRRRADPKLRGLLNSVHDLEWVVTGTEAEALLTEGRLIKQYKPRYNVELRDDKRFLLLKADPRAPFPRFTTCRFKRDDGARYFGPYVSSVAARAALDFIEKRFGLRKCTPIRPDAETYRHCINDIVRYCAAPCIGRENAAGYRARFDEACAFLRGERPAILRAMREAMDALAADMEFERAAALRDTWMLLCAAVKQRTRLAATPEMKRAEAQQALDVLRDALHLPALPRTIEAFDISTISGTYAVAGLVCFVKGLPDRRRYRRFRIRTVEGMDDPRMMGEAIRRRFGGSRAADARPDLVLVDGGITQLRAARAELDALGLAALPAVGLAKRFEELHVAAGPSPVRLPRDAAALRLLQRVRDEAHRFALDYHRRLRSRRIRESALEGVPGIGQKRAELLLRHFGSIARLARAGEADLVAVPGIGPAMARTIREALGCSV